MKYTELKGNPSNPRYLKDDRFKKLKKSIEDFPEMLALRPIVIDENNMVLGGNMRLKAIESLVAEGKTQFEDVPVTIAKGLTEEQKKEFIIKDNVGFGEWDWDILANEWDSGLLEEWGLSLDVNFAKAENEHDLDYKGDFQVVIECKDEAEQREAYEKLENMGYKCKVLTI